MCAAGPIRTKPAFCSMCMSQSLTEQVVRWSWLSILIQLASWHVVIQSRLKLDTLRGLCTTRGVSMAINIWQSIQVYDEVIHDDWSNLLLHRHPFKVIFNMFSVHMHAHGFNYMIIRFSSTQLNPAYVRKEGWFIQLLTIWSRPSMPHACYICSHLERYWGWPAVVCSKTDRSDGSTRTWSWASSWAVAQLSIHVTEPSRMHVDGWSYPPSLFPSLYPSSPGRPRCAFDTPGSLSCAMQYPSGIKCPGTCAG